MRATVHIEVEVEDEAELKQLTAAAVAALGDRAVGHGYAHNAQEYVVVGTIRGKPNERWRETVLADSPDEAEAAAVAPDDKRVPVVVLPAVSGLVL